MAETEQMKARLEREATKLEQGIAKQSAELREVEDKIKGSIDATEKTTLRLARQQGRMNAVYGESTARVKTIMVRPEGEIGAQFPGLVQSSERTSAMALTNWDPRSPA